MANKTGKGGFKDNPQNQNKKGRPKSFDALRELAQSIAGETNSDKMTVAEKILRDWSKGDFQERKAFIEVAFGKVKDEVAVDGLQKVLVEYINYPTSKTA